LHLAAVEWSLAESIIIETEEDIKSRASWRDRVKPFCHQFQNLVTYCRRLPVMLLADDVGLGKTISAGLILSELMVRGRVNRALIVCPKILGPQWQQELRDKFGLESEVAFGSRLDQALQSHIGIVITTYDSVRERIGEIKRGQFEMLILDEAHRLRNLYGTRQPPRTAQNIREALQARLFTYVLMLTATPLHNRPADIYSLLDCLTVAKGHRHPLGSYEDFRADFIEPNTKERGLRREAIPVLHDVLREYLVRTRRADADLPFPRRYVKTSSAKMTPAEKMLQGLIAGCIQGIGKLQQISLLQAMMSSPLALWHQAHNMIEKGTLPEAVWDDIDRAVRRCQRPAKLTALVSLLNELRDQRPDDWRAVVFTSRRATQLQIGRALAEAGIPYGFIHGDAEQENARALHAFRAQPPRIRVLVSTDAGAEGINLQVANVIVNYDLPWNPMVIEQRIGRCQRLGSNHKHVVVWNLVVTNSVEESVVACLMEKLQTISNAIGDIESILEVLGMEGGGTRSKSFEEQIRELVVASLQGMNIENRRDKIARNIDRARRLIEENQAEIDRVLGSPESFSQRTGKSLRLKHPDPSFPAKEFVVRSLQQEGAVVTEDEDGRCRVRWPDGREEKIIIVNASRRERLTADADDDPENEDPDEETPQVYAPGQPRFEQMVDHWSKRAEQLIVDTQVNDERLCTELAQRWCEHYGFRFLSCRYSPFKKGMYGSVAIRVTASNGIDRYEKVIRARLGSPQKEQAARRAGGRLGCDKITPKDVMQSFETEARRIVAEDSDIRTFCEHYQRREQEELARAQGNARQRQRIINDFRPAVAGECVGMNGCLYSRGQLHITYSIDNFIYEIALQVEPATGQILEPVEEGVCERTGRTVPRAALGRCAASGKTVLQHLLAKSGVSDKKALPEYLGSCLVTGKTALTSELGKSALSGKVVLQALLQRSSLSGRSGLPEEFGKCEITGDAVLKDELERSDLSGRLFRSDQKRVSAVSGKVGHQSEMVRCEVTGEWLAPSEAGKSDFSGKQVRADLLRKSEKSGRKGLADEVVPCAVTGRLLLRDEVGRSAVSGKWCDKDLLQCSLRSGLDGLPQEMARCEETGALLLATETGFCQVTGKRVDNRLLAVSALSGRTVLNRFAVCSVLSRRIGLEDEVGYCNWLDGPVLKDELDVCRLTGLTISRAFLNSDNELRPLRELLNGWSAEATPLPKGAQWLRNQHAEFRSVNRLSGIVSPSKTVIAACAERTGALGLNRRYAGVLIKLANPHLLLAKTAWGKRIRGLWTVAPETGLLTTLASLFQWVLELLGLATTAARSTARNETITPASNERSREPTAACKATQESEPSTTANRAESIAPR
jgi:ERCC4-related helicase